MDEDGRRKVDCDPNCFSKILDVMRMRKRASWAAAAADDEEKVNTAVDDVFGPGGVGAGHAIRIPIAENDQGCFRESVRKLFPGCEDFIMGLVEPWKDALPAAEVTPPLRGNLDRMVGERLQCCVRLLDFFLARGWGASHFVVLVKLILSVPLVLSAGVSFVSSLVVTSIDDCSARG